MLEYTGWSAERAAEALKDMSERRSDCDPFTVREAACILFSMSQRRLDHDSGFLPNDPAFSGPGSPDSIAIADPNTTRHPGDSIIESFDTDTDSQVTIEDLATQADEMARKRKHQSVSKDNSAEDKKPVEHQQPAEDFQPAKRKQPAWNAKPPEETQPAKGEQPAEKEESPRKSQRRSILDDPALVKRSQEIDKAIGFPEGPTKENSDEWLNKKIGYLQRQTKKREATSWIRLGEARSYIARRNQVVPAGWNEIPPISFRSPADGLPQRCTRIQAKTSHERGDKAFQADQTVAATQDDNDPRDPTPPDDNDPKDPGWVEGTEPPSHEGDAQSKPEGRKKVKRRLRANELDTNLGEGWDFKGVTSRGRPSKPMG